MALPAQILGTLLNGCQLLPYHFQVMYAWNEYCLRACSVLTPKVSAFSPCGAQLRKIASGHGHLQVNRHAIFGGPRTRTRAAISIQCLSTTQPAQAKMAANDEDNDGD